MSTTFWAVFAGATSAFLVVRLLDSILDELHTRRHARYLEYLEEQADGLFCDCD
jgi:hypothetical protein